MSHPDAAIVIDDSDKEDCGGSHSDTSTVSLANDIASILRRPARSRRGKSKLISRDSGLSSTTGVRQRPTRGQHVVIVIDCDEPSESYKPLVRF
jgi:hypothetical protein